MLHSAKGSLGLEVPKGFQCMSSYWYNQRTVSSSNRLDQLPYTVGATRSLETKTSPVTAFVFFCFVFLLEFNLPKYIITPSAHPIKRPPQCPSPSHPNLLPTSLSTSPCSFPRVRRLSCSVSHSDISHSFFLLSHLFPFTIFYIPQMNEFDQDNAGK